MVEFIGMVTEVIKYVQLKDLCFNFFRSVFKKDTLGFYFKWDFIIYEARKSRDNSFFFINRRKLEKSVILALTFESRS